MLRAFLLPFLPSVFETGIKSPQIQRSILQDRQVLQQASGQIFSILHHVRPHLKTFLVQQGLDHQADQFLDGILVFPLLLLLLFLRPSIGLNGRHLFSAASLARSPIGFSFRKKKKHTRVNVTEDARACRQLDLKQNAARIKHGLELSPRTPRATSPLGSTVQGQTPRDSTNNVIDKPTGPR